MWTANVGLIYVFIQLRYHMHACAVDYSDSISSECPGYDTKKSDIDAPVILKLWGMRSIRSVPIWTGVTAPNSVLSKSQIERFDS